MRRWDQCRQVPDGSQLPKVIFTLGVLTKVSEGSESVRPGESVWPCECVRVTPFALRYRRAGLRLRYLGMGSLCESKSFSLPVPSTLRYLRANGWCGFDGGAELTWRGVRRTAWDLRAVRASAAACGSTKSADPSRSKVDPRIRSP